MLIFYQYKCFVVAIFFPKTSIDPTIVSLTHVFEGFFFFFFLKKKRKRKEKSDEFELYNEIFLEIVGS